VTCVAVVVASARIEDRGSDVCHQNIQAEHFTTEIYEPDGNFKPLRTTSCKYNQQPGPQQQREQ